MGRFSRTAEGDFRQPERVNARNLDRHLLDSPEPPSEEWVSVQSTNLEAVRYRRSDNSLEVLFLLKDPPAKHRHYRYYGVNWSVYWGLLRASSKGTYHAAHIRNSFPFEPLD